MSVQIQHNHTNGNGNSGNGGGAANNSRAVMQGFIAALKDGFGFIETSNHTKEVFFHFRFVEKISTDMFFEIVFINYYLIYISINLSFYRL